jgi:hypothetical protein
VKLDWGNVPALWGAATGTAALAISWWSARAASKERKQKARDTPWSGARQVTIDPALIIEAGTMVRVQTSAFNGENLPISSVTIRVHSILTQSVVLDRTHRLEPGAPSPSTRL